MSLLENLKKQAKLLEADIYTLYLVAGHPRTPWYAKLLIACVVAYALSPIDLIPDFIPVIGYLDDLILVPLGISIAIKIVPIPILVECRAQAQKMSLKSNKNWKAGVVIVFIWLVLTGLVLTWVYKAIF
jgi:uncharacterized membrane protein YkvA (DUF1232 family)